MCMIDDADPAEFFTSRFHKARKQHKCGECGRLIEPGEKYEYVTAKYSGEMNFHKTCAHCQEARKWLVAQCGGYAWNGVEEDLREHLDYAWLKVGRLVIGMRRGWKKFNGTGLMNLPVVEEKRAALH